MTLSDTEAVILSNPKRFLSCLISNKDQSTKNATIGRSIMRATFPRTLIMPLKIGLVDHFVSKYLIDTLINLDFVNHTKKYDVMNNVQF